MSQNELALQLSISQTTLHNIEAGNSQNTLLKSKVAELESEK